MLTVEKITDFNVFLGLQVVWNALLAESAGATIALTWEWIASWWEVFGAERELFILVVRDGSEVIAIAPLLKRVVQHYALTYRRLEFLASGEDQADEICSDYLDFILQRGREAEALQAIFNYLQQHRTAWDEVILSNMTEESPSLPLLKKISVSHGLPYTVTPTETAFYLPLPSDWETFLEQRSRQLRQKLRRERRVAAEHGSSFEVIDSSAKFDETFDTLIRLHQARWAERGEPGVFASEKFTRFHRLLTPKLLTQGWLKLYVLNIEEEPVSVLYTFHYQQKAYYYQTSFKPVLHRLFSPGTLNISYGIEDAINSGLTEWDFLKGQDDTYKTRWGAETRSIVRVRLAQSQPKELLYNLATRSRNRLRDIRGSLKP